MRIFIAKNGFIVFQSILQNIVFNSIFWLRKSLTTHFSLYVREQKEVIGCQARAVLRMTHQFYVLAVQKSSHCYGTHWSVRFSSFSKDFRQSNCCVPL